MYFVELPMTASLQRPDFGIKIYRTRGCFDWKISGDLVCV